MMQTLLLLVFFVFAFGQAHANQCEGDSVHVTAEIRRAMKENLKLIPLFVRAAFHDCITATKDKPASGCNGSLRLPKERANHRNDELLDGLDLLDDILPGTCVSYADAIQIGMVTAMDLASKGSFPKLNIRTGIPDSEFPDTVREIPNRRANFTVLKEQFLRQGFNSKELVASIVGGHSLGRFLTGQEEEERNFTTTPFVFNIDYAINLVQRIDSGRNLPGFHTIPADRFLLDSPEAVSLVKFFAGQTGRQRDSSNYDSEKGLSRLTKSLARFFEKNSFLTGERVKE